MTTISALPKTMQAAVIDKAGAPDQIQLRALPAPVVTRNHVIIALEYAGVGPWDAEQRSGSYGKIKPDTILGVDGSGTVAAIGAGVNDLKVGDRVFSYSYSNPTGG